MTGGKSSTRGMRACNSSGRSAAGGIKRSAAVARAASLARTVLSLCVGVPRRDQRGIGTEWSDADRRFARRPRLRSGCTMLPLTLRNGWGSLLRRLRNRRRKLLLKSLQGIGRDRSRADAAAADDADAPDADAAPRTDFKRRASSAMPAVGGARFLCPLLLDARRNNGHRGSTPSSPSSNVAPKMMFASGSTASHTRRAASSPRAGSGRVRR